jgi:glycosyltransferase involved in cell wall biosynthesis
MKIILVANTDWYLYNFRLSLASFLRAHGHEISMVSPNGPYAPKIRQAGFHWLEWPVGRKSVGPAELLAIGWLARLYRRESPDLVHHFTVKPVLYGSMAARLAHVPRVVNSVTGLGYVFLQNSMKARLLRWAVLGLYHLAFQPTRQAFIFENCYDREFFEQKKLISPGSGMLIEGVGVDTDTFTPSPEPEGTCLVVLPARMLWDKGVGIAVEAARLLKKENRPIRLALVGPTDPGNPANIPESTLQGWVDEGIVEWWGFQEDMRAVYRKANLVILPSFGEGIPTVLLEAGACGRAIIASNVSGCRDVICDGETGLLVQPKDPVGLAQAIQRLASDPALRAKLAMAGRAQVVDRFSTEIINRQTLEVYQRLVNRSCK